MKTIIRHIREFLFVREIGSDYEKFRSMKSWEEQSAFLLDCFGKGGLDVFADLHYRVYRRIVSEERERAKL